jgi:hypothetical protein
MFKKTLLLGGCVTTLFAGPVLAQETYFKSGFLVGAHAGFSHALRSFKNTFNPDLAPIVYPESASGKARKDGAVLGVLGGYRHIFQNNMTLGVDVSGDIYVDNALEAHIILPFAIPLVVSNHLSRQLSVTPSVHFGRTFLGRWHVALGLGLGISRFSSRVILDNGFDEPLTLKSKMTKASFVPSVRAEYAATPKLSVIGNISYEICKKITKNFDNQAIQMGGAHSYLRSSIAPRYVTVKIGAVYRL